MWAIAAGAPAQSAAPVTPPGGVVDMLHGVAVPDPYRHLEDVASPAVQDWMRGQSDHARAVLARIPGRDALRDALRSAGPGTRGELSQVMRETEGRWFYLKRAAGEQAFRLMLRRRLDGPERLLVDPAAQARAGGPLQAITYHLPAPGGRWVAYGIAAGGSEDAVLRVVGAGSGRHYGEPIDRAELGGLAWTPDGKQLLFNRLQARPAGVPAGDRYLDSQVWMWRPGQPLAKARAVFGRGQHGVALDPVDMPTVQLTHDGRWALGVVMHGGTQPELMLYVSDAASLRAGRPRWRRAFGYDAGIVQLAYMNDMLVLLSHQGAPRRKLLAMPVAAGLEAAREILPESTAVLLEIAAAADALYLRTREGNAQRLYRRPWTAAAGEPLRPVALPVPGSFRLHDDAGASAAHARLPGLVLGVQGWTRPSHLWLLQADGSARDTGLLPAMPGDAADTLAVTDVLVPSHDGARVPMSIVHRKDTLLNGRNPVLLMGYASYGHTMDPRHRPEHLAWLGAGGVLAVANPRGSGALGDDWYRAGRQATKPNTWKDFIACAQWLVDGGWTRPARLAILSGSAGGILVGRAMTERPDLFGAVVSLVGSMDMLRSEFSPNGAPNVPEFGSQATEAGFRALLAMSPYHHIEDGVKYPATLFIHGVNDPRVDVWESAKAAARMQAVAAGVSGGRPALLRLDWDAGHGIGATRDQQLDQWVDVLSFLLWQLGTDAYQPK